MATIVQSVAIPDFSAYPGAFVLPSNVTPGNHILIVLAHSYAGCPVTATDDLGNAYAFEGTQLRNGTSSYLEVFTAPVTTGGTCTVAPAAGCGTARAGIILEVSGLDQATPYLGENDASVMASPVSSGTIAGVNVGDLLVTLCLVGTTGATVTPTTGDTQLGPRTADGDYVFTRLASVAGTQDFAATYTGTASAVDAYTVAFKAAATSTPVGFGGTRRAPGRRGPFDRRGFLKARAWERSIAATVAVVVAAGTGDLQATGFAPTVAVSNNQIAAAGTGAVSAAGFAPTVVIGVRVATGVGALTATGFAPTVAVSNNQVAAAGVGAATFAGFAPAVAVSNNQRVLPGLGAATFTGLAPATSIGVRVAAGVGALTAAGFAPTIAISNHQTVAAGLGQATFTGFAPTVISGSQIIVTPGVGALTVSGFAPVVAISDNQRVLAGAGSALFSGFAPTIQLPVSASPGAGQVIVTGFAPTILLPQTARPGAGALTATGFAPTVAISPTVSPAVSPTRVLLTDARTVVNVQLDRRTLTTTVARAIAQLKSTRTAVEPQPTRDTLSNP